jgi:protein-disulfide isomerase
MAPAIGLKIIVARAGDRRGPRPPGRISGAGVPARRARGAYGAVATNLGMVEQKPVKVVGMDASVEQDESDLTRKQRREQARAQRKALEEAEAAREVRRKRLSLLGIVVAAVVVIIVVILLATGTSSNSTVKPKGSGGNKAATEVNSLLAGIPQNGNVLGNPNAPVTLRYFGDLECPVCKEFTVGALPSLIQGYVRQGKLKIEYNSMETATREPETFKTQQVAALAAGKQAKMWHYIELFYHEQGEEDSGYVTEKYLQELAEQVPGLKLAQWTSDRSDLKLAEQVASDGQTASNNGFTGTPSFLIGKSGGATQKLEYLSLTDPSSFDAAIERELKS